MAVRHRDAHIGRYRQIARVLARHGLGYLASVTGLTRYLPLTSPLPRAGQVRDGLHTPPQHVRMALEELGPTFIKLGQVLSTRPDLLPPAYIAELAKLQDAAPPVPVTAVQETLVAELGCPTESAFASFDPVPLAAASIGQVHAATLKSGAEVVVKIRRPGVVEQVEEDLEILQNLAASASHRWQFAEQYDIVGLAQEFAHTIRAELDYIHEGRNAERFASNFAADPGVHIPRVYWETTTSRVLTLERIRGTKINDINALDAAGIDRAALADRAANIILKMVFDNGFYHADPHPGNFFIEAGGRIGLIDFGMTGTLDSNTQEKLVELLLSVTGGLGGTGRDSDRMVDALLDLGVAHGRVDRTALRQDLDHLVAQYYGSTLQEMDLRAVLNDSFAVIRAHHLQLPSNLALLVKTLLMDEGLGVQLDPDFNLAASITPYARRLIIRQYSPFLWVGRLGQAGLDAARLGVELPQQVRRLMLELERGGLQVGMRPEGFDPIIERLERLANRIVLGILAAAFVVGLAVLMSFYQPPGWEQWIGTIFAVGFLLAGGLGIYLAWSILRSGRK